MKQLKEFTTVLSERLRESGRYETAKRYQTVLNSFLAFTGQEEVKFESLTPALLLSYEAHLKNKACRQNTISLYIRTLRAICHQAEREEEVKLPPHLFDYLYTGQDPTTKRALSLESLNRIVQFKATKKNVNLAFTRDMYMLSFYLRGIPFVDLAHLRHTDIRDGILYYHRSKTGQPLFVQLDLKADEIIRRHVTDKNKSCYLLPLIKRPGDKDEHRQYESALRLYNKRLKLLAKELGIKENLTSYVVRHSWATIAYDHGISVAYISESLGHNSEEVTYHYLESFTIDALTNVNNFIIDIVTNMSKENKYYKEESVFSRKNKETGQRRKKRSGY
ncbi:site-specific integrase [Bacteroides sp.]|uniref:tyrosine-type recombinase/integrase n=1 Tax=Bacteroides sp. TaxID=29523 RepID=UPI0025C65696|nr:site-specific integrase [Bacteroides sp.]